MHHSTFISNIANIYRPKVYVELGLYEGETLRKVLPYVEHGFGVDMKRNTHLENLEKQTNVTITYTTTDEFFTTFNHKIDMAFIDADHCATSAYNDLQNVLQRLNPGGIVIMHDTDPESDSLIHPGYCGDSFKLVDILEKDPELNVLTLPISEAGLSIITRKSSSRTQRRHTHN